MTTTPDRFRADAERVAYPVDSTTRPCCGGIGIHTPDCPEQRDLSVPGATVDFSEKEGPAMATTTTPKFPRPAGAVDVGEWEAVTIDADSLPNVFRTLDGSERVVERPDYEHDVVITIGGLQYIDGDVTRNIYVGGADGPFTLAEARQFARALIAAVDECEQLASHDAIEAAR